MSSLTVVHINTEAGWRGGEVQTLLLARGLRDRGHRQTLAVRAGGALAARASADGLEVWTHPMRSEFDPGAIAGLAGLIRRCRPDVLHYHTSHAITLGTLAGLFASPSAGRVAAVLTRRVSFSLARNPIARLKYGFRVDHVIAVAEGIRSVLVGHGIPSGDVSVVHSGIDLTRFAPGTPGTDDAAAAGRRFREEAGIPATARVVAAVGALVAHKGHGVLIDALAALAARRPELRAVIVGDGPLREDLERRVEAAELSGRAHFTGHREDVPAILAAVDLLALPSLSGEGSPASVKEAMASGVPVVASALDGVREIVAPDVEALLCPPGDAEALGAAIGRLLDDGDLRAALAARGREKVRQFSAETMVERTEAVYRRVVGAGGPRRAKGEERA